MIHVISICYRLSAAWNERTNTQQIEHRNYQIYDTQNSDDDEIYLVSKVDRLHNVAGVIHIAQQQHQSTTNDSHCYNNNNISNISITTAIAQHPYIFRPHQKANGIWSICGLLFFVHGMDRHVLYKPNKRQTTQCTVHSLPGINLYERTIYERKHHYLWPYIVRALMMLYAQPNGSFPDCLSSFIDWIFPFRPIRPIADARNHRLSTKCSSLMMVSARLVQHHFCLYVSRLSSIPSSNRQLKLKYSHLIESDILRVYCQRTVWFPNHTQWCGCSDK